MNDDQNEALKLVRRGIALEMVTMRRVREKVIQRPFMYGHDLGYIRALQSTGKTVKRMINTPDIWQKEGGGVKVGAYVVEGGKVTQ